MVEYEVFLPKRMHINICGRGGKVALVAHDNVCLW